MMQYKDKLKDSRWLAKRQAVLERDSFRCVICGSNNGLNVHHSAYIYGREPWEYDNKYLVTLCHKCHAKLHGKYAVKQTYVDGIVFFRTLLGRAKNLTPTERIMYSFLASKSIMCNSEIFDKDGAYVNKNALQMMLIDTCRIPLYEMSISKIATEIGVSKKTAITAMANLRINGYIKDDMIFVNNELVENGYFELCYKEGLSGWTLIFYSFLVDRARIDKYTSLTRKQMAGILKVNIKSIDQYLAKLSSLGLIERINDYKLKVYI